MGEANDSLEELAAARRAEKAAKLSQRLQRKAARLAKHGRVTVVLSAGKRARKAEAKFKPAQVFVHVFRARSNCSGRTALNAYYFFHGVESCVSITNVRGT